VRIGISCYPTIGGSGAVATELGKALAHRGHQVHFIVTDVPFRLGEFHQNIYVHEIDTATYPVLRTPPYDLTLAALMANIVDRYDLEILHVHYALPFAVCAFLAKQMVPDHPVKVITTLHGTDVTVLAEDKSLFDVMKLGIDRSDAVTAVSQSLALQTQELFKIEKDIHTLYNFVDPQVFKPSTSSPRSCFADPGEKVLLHMSNFRKVKRVPDVIHTFAAVNQAVPSKLLLVGEGPELNEARSLVSSLGLNDRVRFLGKQDEVASLFAASDLFILPSEKESFGLVALEAMATGIPVIGSWAGGIPEVVTHGETGFLANIGDVEAMAGYAIRLLSDSELYAQFSSAGRIRAEQVFNLQSRVEEYERLYEMVLEGSRV
jgi:N-acetyl-alpha-D-glucosaminyl L-malate synthase BshA